MNTPTFSKSPLWLQSEPSNNVVLGIFGEAFANIAERNFSTVLSRDQSDRIFNSLLVVLEDLGWQESDFSRISEIESLICMIQYERQNIPREVIKEPMNGFLAISPDESKTIMINWIDHIKFSVRNRSIDFSNIIFELENFDAVFGKNFQRSWKDNIGYLSANPSNSGAGAIFGGFVHTPGLVMTGQYGRLKRELRENGFLVTGIFDGGAEEVSGFLQVVLRNLAGNNVEQLAGNVEATLIGITNKEIEAREMLWNKSRTQTEDKISRSVGIITHAKLIESWEISTLLSAIRLGVSLEIFPMSFQTVDDVLITSRDAHLAFQIEEKANYGKAIPQRRIELLSKKLWFS